MALQADAASSRIEVELRRAREFLERHASAEALGLATTLLEQSPKNRDALYIVAVSQRRLGRTEAALAAYERAVALNSVELKEALAGLAVRPPTGVPAVS